MQPSEQEMLIASIGATAEVMGTQLQPNALMLMAQDLSGYRLSDVLSALKRVRHEVSGRLSLAAIIDRIQGLDGLLGADEAWALMSRPESETIIVNDPMTSAMRVARPLLDDGDKIGARMAFKDSYTRLVSDYVEKGVKPRWFVSFGFDKEGRAQPIAEGVRLGKLSLEHSLGLLSPQEKAEVLKLTGNENHPLLIEFKQAKLEEKRPNASKNFQELKEFLKGKKV